MNLKVFVGVVVIILFLGVCLYLGGAFLDDQSLKTDSQKSSVSRGSLKSASFSLKGKGHKKTVKSKKTGQKEVVQKRPTVNMTTNLMLTTLERELLDELQLALDEENINVVRIVAPALAKSLTADVRSKVVESLRWFKLKALPELRSMLSDADPDVAREAGEGWQDAVAEIADDAVKAKELFEGMTQIQDVDLLNEAIMGYYDIDDGMALGYIVQLINSGNPNASLVGRDGYEHITGDPYVSNENAQRWIDQWRKGNPLSETTP